MIKTKRNKEQKLDHHIDTLNKFIKTYLNNRNHSYELLINKLELLNPLGILKKGYSIVTKDDKTIKTAKDLKQNDEINVRFSEGTIKATVKEID